VDAEINDAVLMERYREGDAAAFELLYSRHKGPLYRYLLRQCRPPDAAADVFQEIWSRVIVSRERYEVRAEFKTYLYRIAHHCVIDHYRLRDRKRANRMESVDDHADALVAYPHDQPDARLSQQQLDGAFRQALADLPDEQRQAFLLFEESGMALKEIADVTGVPAETVKSRLRYALAKLRRTLADDFGMSAVLKPVRAES
jgi:RNA polymerase sigma-70 factor, ECF subfamily